MTPGQCERWRRESGKETVNRLLTVTALAKVTEQKACMCLRQSPVQTAGIVLRSNDGGTPGVFISYCVRSVTDLVNF